MKITDVIISRIHGRREVTDESPPTLQAHPIDLYSENQRVPTSGLKLDEGQISALFFEIESGGLRSLGSQLRHHDNAGARNAGPDVDGGADSTGTSE